MKIASIKKSRKTPRVILVILFSYLNDFNFSRSDNKIATNPFNYESKSKQVRKTIEFKL